MNRIIAGTMTWGEWGRKFSTTESAQLIRDCVSLGLTTFDHADIYGGYTTEALFGRGFRESGISRDRVIHISKCGIQYPCLARPLDVKHYDYSKKHLIASAEKSLENLQTDYLDVLLLHRPSPLLQVEEVAQAFTELKQKGKVKAFGLSNFTPSQIALIQSTVPIEWNQVECSLSQSSALFDGTLDYHQTHGLGTMAWSPLGNYFDPSTPKNDKLYDLMKILMEKYNTTEDQLLLAWLLQHPAHIHPVVGTTRIERLKVAKDAIHLTLELQDWFLLLEAYNGKAVP